MLVLMESVNFTCIIGVYITATISMYTYVILGNLVIWLPTADGDVV